MSDTILASAIEPKPVRWLWPGWLPEGVLVVLDGDPDVGKSTLTCDLAARLSRGELAGRPVTTILINGEDAHEHTVRPRLGAAGADLGRVALWKFDAPLSLPDDIDRLRDAIREHGAGLVVIDPLTAFLGKTAAAANDQAVRRALMPLIRLAAETGCTVLIVRHLRKQNGKALYRGLGSIGIVGAARVGWLLGKHPRGDGLRALTVTKMNLAAPPVPRVLHTAGGKVTWVGEEPGLTADEVAGRDAGTAAVRWLEQVVSRGPKPATEVKAEAAAAGFSERTLWRAKRAAAVVARKYFGIWYWCQPGDDPALRFAGLSPVQVMNPKCQSEVEPGPTLEPRDPYADPAEQKRWAKRVLRGAGIRLTGPAANGTNATDGPHASPGFHLSHSAEAPDGTPGLHSSPRQLQDPAELPEGGDRLRPDLPLLPPVPGAGRPDRRPDDRRGPGCDTGRRDRMVPVGCVEAFRGPLRSAPTHRGDLPPLAPPSPPRGGGPGGRGPTSPRREAGPLPPAPSPKRGGGASGRTSFGKGPAPAMGRAPPHWLDHLCLRPLPSR